MGAGHSHVTGPGGHRNPLLAVFGVTLTVLVAEVIGGLISGSLALLADAGHTLTDAAGIGLALLAAASAARQPPPSAHSGTSAPGSSLRMSVLGSGSSSVTMPTRVIA